MAWTTIVAVMFGAVAVVGAGCFLYQLYHVIVTDAKTRGFKHPSFWGMLPAMGNEAAGGVLLYLIRRKNCPVVHITEQERQEIIKRKQATGVGLAFVCVGVIGMLICLMMF